MLELSLIAIGILRSLKWFAMCATMPTFKTGLFHHGSKQNNLYCEKRTTLPGARSLTMC